MNIDDVITVLICAKPAATDDWFWPDDILMSLAAQHGWSSETLNDTKNSLCEQGYFLIDEDGCLTDPSLVVEDGKISINGACFFKNTNFVGVTPMIKGDSVEFKALDA